MLLVAWVVRYVCTKQEIDPDGKKVPGWLDCADRFIKKAVAHLMAWQMRPLKGWGTLRADTLGPPPR